MSRLTVYTTKMSNRYLLAGLSAIISEEYDRHETLGDNGGEEYIESCTDYIDDISSTFTYFTNFDGYETCKAEVTPEVLIEFLQSKGLSIEGFPRNVKDTKTFTKELIEFLERRNNL